MGRTVSDGFIWWEFPLQCHPVELVSNIVWRERRKKCEAKNINKLELLAHKRRYVELNLK